ncbi:MAG: hydantoinase/oxoprolinase family protein [Thermacetogeniaceae bacterium]|nr:hydantoinase/oxoprolinase family protein [Syntrophomonadaceae bacterium]
MSLVLGIDTGGTYTDGIILDVTDQRVVAKAKVLTTHDDLTRCITDCFRELKCDAVHDIKMIALSTTLATNAVVEGHGGEVGLLLIGSEPIDKLPAAVCEIIKGGHDAAGKPQAELDVEEVRNAIRKMCGRVEAVAISSFFSVRNPEHEQKARELVREMMDVPVVCGHELSSSLGFYERAVTAVLNAKLLPIIASLIESVKKVLREEGINAPLMIVKGDGSLMSESVARVRPIETLLSGPAASIYGAVYCGKVKDALVLDMGGTTTDIAVLSDEVPKINDEGAVVGGWRTRVRAAEINTYGIGGDSYIQIDKDKNLIIGPNRVWPLALAADRYPHLVEELSLQWETKKFNSLYSQPTDCFILVQQDIAVQMTTTEKEAVQLLKEQPHTLQFLADKMGTKTFFLDLSRLVEMGILNKASVTPTDILHANGRYTRWNREASILGVKMLAHKMGKSYQEFLDLAMEAIINKIALSILQSVVNFEGKDFDIQDEKGAMYFIGKLLQPKKAGRLMGCSLEFNLPLVAIGAPVNVYLPEVASKLKLDLIIPPNAEIANAIGAASGNVVEAVQVLIRHDDEQYIVHAPWERKVFDNYDDAIAYAQAEAAKKAAVQIEKAGAADYQLTTEKEEVNIPGWDILMETRITVTAVGKPKWLS